MTSIRSFTLFKLALIKNYTRKLYSISDCKCLSRFTSLHVRHKKLLENVNTSQSVKTMYTALNFQVNAFWGDVAGFRIIPPVPPSKICMILEADSCTSTMYFTVVFNLENFAQFKYLLTYHLIFWAANVFSCEQFYAVVRVNLELSVRVFALHESSDVSIHHGRSVLALPLANA